VNIENILQLIDEGSAEARRTGISRVLTLEDAYRMVVPPTP